MQAGLWVLAGSRRGRPGALHIVPGAELRIDLEGALEEVHRNALVGEEGDHNLVGELYSRLVMTFLGLQRNLSLTRRAILLVLWRRRSILSWRRSLRRRRAVMSLLGRRWVAISLLGSCNRRQPRDSTSNIESVITHAERHIAGADLVVAGHSPVELQLMSTKTSSLDYDA